MAENQAQRLLRMTEMQIQNTINTPGISPRTKRLLEKELIKAQAKKLSDGIDDVADEEDEILRAQTAEIEFDDTLQAPDIAGAPSRAPAPEEPIALTPERVIDVGQEQLPEEQIADEELLRAPAIAQDFVQPPVEPIVQAADTTNLEAGFEEQKKSAKQQADIQSKIAKEQQGQFEDQSKKLDRFGAANQIELARIDQKIASETNKLARMQQNLLSSRIDPNRLVAKRKVGIITACV